ncbi:MAG TPA: S4 domain-containing protein [Vicinamibacterales bacterium]|nr:S4 domain-containing protein [Vicinamibacterales bacterium]
MRYKHAHVALERPLSKLGLASRTQAQQLIRAGQVTVNRQLVTDPLDAVNPDIDAIALRGASASPYAWRTIAFHKPRGVVTTRRDPQGRRTVFDVLGRAARVWSPWAAWMSRPPACCS